MNITEKALQFTNACNQEFIGRYNSEEFRFAAKESKILPEYLASHFSEAWITDQINKDIANEREEKKLTAKQPETIMTNNLNLRNKYKAMCLAETGIQGDSETKLKINILNAKTKQPVADTPSGEEEDFEGLDDNDEIKIPVKRGRPKK